MKRGVGKWTEKVIEQLCLVTMFVLVVLQDLIRTIPEDFDRDSMNVIKEQIELKYVNKVLPGAGLGISFYDLVSLGDTYVYPAEGL